MSDAIGGYLERCRRRLAWVARARVAAAGGALVGVLTIAFAVAAAHLVPAQGWIVAARVILYSVVVATVAAVVLRRIGSRHAARRTERRIPAFDGRLTTWFDAVRRRKRSALLPQLAQDAGRVATANPPRRVVPTWLFAAPLATFVSAAALLTWSLAGAPQSWRLPAERLWLGDAFADTRPRIVVEPGDTVVPRGADVLLRARAHGFAAGALQVNAAFAGSADWQQADMLPPSNASGAHEFVLVAVTESVDYFVASSGVNSDRFRIEVADLPMVDSVDVTLNFPAWTRLDPVEQDHGDVAGVVGTTVRVRVGATASMNEPRLLVNGRATRLDDDGVGAFAIEAAGTWRVAVSHLGAIVPISDDYFIDVIDDAPPEVEFAFPGRDRSATAIEEVALRFRATDDFGVETLTLNYAVNGGSWLRVPADASTVGREATAAHTIYFEDLVVGDEDRAVRPGDVVSLYAEAADHRQTTASALYFVDVRPFDKRYREQVGSGGGGGGSGGESGLELSGRQREIASATWNLIRERDAGSRSGDDLRDQTDMLAILQRTLLDQANTLVARAEGRRLDDEEEVEPFVAELAAAAVEMERAADTLARHELDQAVAPEQRALQHLLTAEASLRDVDVSLSRESSSGGAASRSLSELADLELDPQRNRYETPQSPRFGEVDDSAQDEWQRLTELARRQEELARRQERDADQEMPLSRWQLERLQRELESLRQRLAGEDGQRTADRSDGGTPSSQASGAARSPGATGDLRDAIAELDEARNAIERSLADGDGADAAAIRQGAAALRAGANQLLRREADELAERVGRAERDASRLLADQQRILERLEALRDETLAAARNGERLSFRSRDMDDEAATKRRMQGDLARIAGELADTRQALADAGGENDAVVDQLDHALNELAESRVAERLAIAAEYFEYGRPLFMVGHEARVADALAQFRDRIGRAARRLADARGAAGRTPGVDDVQALRQRLRETGIDGDPDSLRDIAEAAGRLAAEVLSGQGTLDLREMRERYRGLGAADENRERLYRLTLAQLDQIEIALGKVGGVPIRALQPRDDGYAADAVARYFRTLSCTADGC